MTDIEGKKKVEYNAERKADADRDLKYVVDKIKNRRSSSWQQSGRSRYRSEYKIRKGEV